MTDREKKIEEIRQRWSDAYPVNYLLEEIERLQQERDKAVAALIVERDDALEWDGVGTVNRINKALSELGVSL